MRVVMAGLMGLALLGSGCASMPMFGGDTAYSAEKVTENRWRVSCKASRAPRSS